MSQETIAQLAPGMNPGQIRAWKKALVKGAGGVFGNGQKQKTKN